MSSVTPFDRSNLNAPMQTHAPAQRGEQEVADGYWDSEAFPNEESRGQNVRYYLGVLLKRRWSAITAFVVLFMGMVIYNFTAVPIYQASARVLVEFEELNPVVAEDVFRPYDPWRSLEPELAVLESRWLAKRTVEALGLSMPDGQPIDDETETNDVAVDVSGTWPTAWSAIRTFASKSFGVGTPVQEASDFPDASAQAGEQPSGESPFGESSAEAARINTFRLHLAGDNANLTDLYLYFLPESAINLVWPMSGRVRPTMSARGSSSRPKNSHACTMSWRG